MVLKLEAIRIRNFKSFRGEHTISGFDEHMTAIVGPNGSGKSNIIDSILFVLGYRAKKMRHSTLKDLISNGCSDCFVELKFNEFTISRSLGREKKNVLENGGKKVDLHDDFNKVDLRDDFNKVDLRDDFNKVNSNHGTPDICMNKKTINTIEIKNCISRYCLDGQDISTSDIMAFLKNKGIDLDNNRFLILQGEIENISMLGPLELLSYIEDCIGTSSYKNDIEKIDKELVSRGSDLDALANSLKFLETDYLFKKGKIDEKITYLVYKGETLGLESSIVDLKEERAFRRDRLLTEQTKEMEIEISELQRRNQEHTNKIKILEKQRESLDLKNKEDELLLLRREAQKIERENKSKIQRKKELGKFINQLEKNISDMKIKGTDWEKESVLYEVEKQKNQLEIDSIGKDIRSKEKIVNLCKEVREFGRIKERNEHVLVGLLKKKDLFLEVKEEIKFLEHQMNELRKSNENVVNVPEDAIISLQKEIKTLNEDMKATRQEIQARQRRADDFKYLEEMYKRDTAVHEALRNVKGVYGPLKNLGKVHSGYEIAVEASTRSLNSIVVENTAVAEECIGIITKKGLNRTTFIILDKVMHGGASNRSKVPNNDDRLLYKKIDFEERFFHVFYFALKDTLVVSSIEEARKLAFGPTRRRVVTEDGKLLEKSGLMSGGKTAKKLKGVSELEDILGNMKAIADKKTSDLECLVKQRNEAINIEKEKKRMCELENQVNEKRGMYDSVAYDKVLEDIEILKAETKKCGMNNLPAEIKDLINELHLLNEKIEYLEKINQNLKIKLSCPPVMDTKGMVNELYQMSQELSAIELTEMETSQLERIEKEYQKISNEFKAIQDNINTIRASIGQDYHEEADLKNKLDDTADGLAECKEIIYNCKIKRGEVKKEISLVHGLLKSCGMAMDELPNEMSCDVKEMEDSELKAKSKDLIEELNKRENENFQKIKAMHSDSTVDDIELYKALFLEYNSSRAKYEENKGSHGFISNKIQSLKSELQNMKEERLSKFMEGFNAINGHIKAIFSMVTFGGNAELDLVDYLNPFSEGIVLSIMPLKKSWKQVSNLSGGEKTLASLSLIFALHKYRPSAFYVMDEIDAALDYKNVSIIAQYLAQVKSQFILISLRDSMFENAKTLIGVYKSQEVSRSVVVDVNKISLE